MDVRIISVRKISETNKGKREYFESDEGDFYARNLDFIGVRRWYKTDRDRGELGKLVLGIIEFRRIDDQES